MPFLNYYWEHVHLTTLAPHCLVCISTAIFSCATSRIYTYIYKHTHTHIYIWMYICIYTHTQDTHILIGMPRSLYDGSYFRTALRMRMYHVLFIQINFKPCFTDITMFDFWKSAISRGTQRMLSSCTMGRWGSWWWRLVQVFNCVLPHKTEDRVVTHNSRGNTSR